MCLRLIRGDSRRCPVRDSGPVRTVSGRLTDSRTGEGRRVVVYDGRSYVCTLDRASLCTPEARVRHGVRSTVGVPGARRPRGRRGRGPGARDSVCTSISVCTGVVRRVSPSTVSDSYRRPSTTVSDVEGPVSYRPTEPSARGVCRRRDTATSGPLLLLYHVVGGGDFPIGSMGGEPFS